MNGEHVVELEHLYRGDGAWLSPARVRISAEGNVVAVEPGHDAKADERERGWALPGLPNLHSHAFQRGMAGLAERAAGPGDSFWTWRTVMYRFVHELEPEDVTAIAAQLYAELLEGGYTSVAEFHYLHRQPNGDAYDDPAELTERIIEATGLAGIDATVLPVLYAHSGFGGAELEPHQQRFRGDPEWLLELVFGSVKRHSSAGLRFGVAPHSLRAVTEGELGRLVDGARALAQDLPVHVHIAEQPKEVEDCLAATGQRPIEWLLDHASVDARWCLVHATHATDGELRRVAEAGAVAGLCPTTEANLGDGIFDWPRFAAAGGSWGIGSDSHVCRNAAEELRLLEYGLRLRTGARNVLAGDGGSTGERALDAALAGGARALGLQCGAIEPGRRANLVVLDPEDAALCGTPANAVIDSWIFGGARVRDVMVGGRWVVRHGRHVNRDVISARFAERIARLRGVS